MKGLIGATVFLAALLLFLVEPMAARELLPVFGGSAAVWITCLVFFQGALLCGYLYADFVARRGGRAWIAVHVLLLLVAVMSAWVWALGWLGSGWAASSPVVGIFARLTLWIGVPFLLLAATSPLLQAWVARLGRVPYRLFGLSNLASLLALLAYPTVVEPYLTLQTQRLLWSAGVTVFALLAGIVAWRTHEEPVASSTITGDGAASRRRTKLLWFLLPMVSAMQLSAVTEHLTVNVAAIPLLWILPLSVYLATFVVAFEFGRSLPRHDLLGLLVVLLVGLGSFVSHPDMGLRGVAVGIGLFLLELLVACMFCHSELYGLRPQRADEVTRFYLTIAAGGAAGAFLVGIVAPLVFHADYDLSITFAFTGLLVLAICWGEGTKQRLLWGVASLLLLFFLSSLRFAPGRRVLYSTRNFYGALRVTDTLTAKGDELRTLMHGTVTHGTQMFTPELQRVPTTYYGRDSGLGLALRLCCGDRARRIGVVGLGAGTLAAYGRPGDQMRFYEINPAVRPIAQNLFAYLRDSAATISIAEGDARASLAAEPAQGFDVLAIDAFSGDAIPLHLLTVQALAIYRKHLAPGGVLAFHVSNRYVDLVPELAELANSAGMEAREVMNEEDEPDGKWVSTWVLLTTNDDLLRAREMAKAHMPARRAGVRAWTDDYSSLLPLIRW